MTHQNQQPASAAAKRIIELWNASNNSFFMTVEAEDGPNPPEILVNVRSNDENLVRAAKKDLHFLARLMETATIQHIQLAKNAKGELKPTEEGQKALDDSGKSSSVTSVLLMTLAMVFIEEPKDSEEISEEDMLTMLQLLAQGMAESDSDNDETAGSLQIREKVIDKENGKDIKHITINVLSEDPDADKNLKALQEEFVNLYKAEKITVQLKPYTQEEIEALQKSFGS